MNWVCSPFFSAFLLDFMRIFAIFLPEPELLHLRSHFSISVVPSLWGKNISNVLSFSPLEFKWMEKTEFLFYKPNDFIEDFSFLLQYFDRTSTEVHFLVVFPKHLELVQKTSISLYILQFCFLNEEKINCLKKIEHFMASFQFTKRVAS